MGYVHLYRKEKFIKASLPLAQVLAELEEPDAHQASPLTSPSKESVKEESRALDLAAQTEVARTGAAVQH